MAHLRTTTQKANIIIIIIKVHKSGEMEINKGLLIHVQADKVQNEERR